MGAGRYSDPRKGPDVGKCNFKAEREAWRRTGASSWPLPCCAKHLGRKHLGRRTREFLVPRKTTQHAGDGMQTPRGKRHRLAAFPPPPWSEVT